jgi:hypothetical protein
MDELPDGGFYAQAPMTEFPKNPCRDGFSEDLRVGSGLRKRNTMSLLHELERRSKDVC